MSSLYAYVLLSICLVSSNVFGAARTAARSAPARSTHVSSGSSGLFVGLGYFSQNSLYRNTTKDTGKTELLGTAMYPLIFGYKTTVFDDWIVTPQLQWTVMPRDTDTAKMSFLFLDLPVGGSFWDSFEWFVGPGLFWYSIAGKGGTKVMSNGTGTATFGVGDRTSTTKTVTMDLGVAFNLGANRFSFGSVSEGFLSTSGKRSYNLYLNWTYGLQEIL